MTVMVGNGFDLSAGLKTSTTRFMDFFSKYHASDEGPVGRLAGCIEKEGAREWADFEKKLGEYTSNLEVYGEKAVEAALDCKEAIDVDLAAFIASEDKRVTDEFIEANSESVIDSLAYWCSALQPLERQRILGYYSTDFELNVSIVTFNYTTLLPRLFHAFGTSGHATQRIAGVFLPSGSFILSRLTVLSDVSQYVALMMRPRLGRTLFPKTKILHPPL